MNFIGMIPAGFAVGLIVGLVGVGGGSLMTPILVLFFGIAPKLAVGTDLLFASLTKSVGVWIHHDKHQSVDWKIVRRLAYGSIPGALMTLALIHYIPTFGGHKWIQNALAIALLFTAAALWFGDQLKLKIVRWTERVGHNPSPFWSVVTGLILGVLVTMTSIGAGALGTVVLLMLYPHLPIKKIVGTDLAHAIPLTAVAGLGHAHFGNVDYPLLMALLVGSIPGIYLGSHWSGRLHEQTLKFLLAAMLCIIAAKLLT